MNAYARSLALFAVAGHIVFATVQAYASASVSSAAHGALSGAGLLRLAQTSGNGDGAGPSGGAAAGGHGGGGPPAIFRPSGDPSSDDATSGCAAGLKLPDPADYAKLIDGVAEISRQTQEYIARCGCKSQACVADALDQYADALAKAAAAPPASRAERLLPRALRDLPKVIHAAAAKARAAATPREAGKAVAAAIVVVRKTVAKTISLMRAADPDAKREATRGGALVADTLKTAGDSLERADSL
jgi:hypothetical protein